MATNIGSGILLEATSMNSGTGNYDSFVRIQNNGEEEGFNTDTSKQLDNKDGNWTHSIKFSDLAITVIDGVSYYEIRLDLNEQNSKTGPNVTLNDLQFFSGAAATDAASLGGLHKEFDLSGSVALTDQNSGSGTDDYRFLVPVSMFSDTSGYFTLYADFTGADGGFEEFRATRQTEQAPGITVEKVATPDTINEGSSNDITYTYTLTSQSASTDPLNIDSLVDDNGTAGNTSDDVNLLTQGTISGDADHDGLLDSNETWTVSYTRHGVGTNMNAGDTLTNVVKVVAHDDENVSASGTDTATVTADDVAPGITLEKSVDKDHVNEGTATNVTYTYAVTSQSASTDPLTVTSLIDDKGTASTADDVDLIADGTFLGGDTDGDGKLDAGETWKYSYTTSVGAGMNAGDELTNTATVVAHDDEANSATDSDTATVTAENVDPAITLVKDVDTATVSEGTATDVTYTYTLTSQSASTDPLTLDSLVDNMGTASTADDVDLLADGTLVGDDGDGVLEAGETWKVSYTTSVGAGMNAGDTLTNTATVVAHDDEDNSVTDSDNATVTADDVAPAITLEKAADKASISEGTPTDVTYTYTVTSQSVSTDPLTLTSLIDDNGTAAAGDDVDIITVGTFIGGDTDGDHKLDADESWVYTYTAHNLSLNVGNLTNTAVVIGKDDEGNSATSTDSATVTIDNVDPAISLVKDVDKTHISEGTGTNVTYTYTLTNSSTASTDPLTLTALVDDNGTAGDTSDDVNILTQGVLAAGSDANSNGTLDKGETWVYSYTTNVGANMNAGTTLTNVATVTAHDDENNQASSHDDATVTADNVNPAVNLVKTVDKTVVNEGTTPQVTYTYAVTSQSASTDPLSITSLMDDNGTSGNAADDVNVLTAGAFTGGDTDGDGKLDAGETWTYTYTTNLAKMNAGGSITNTAVVHATDDENNDATSQDDATVTAKDVLPGITLVKDANKASITEGTATDVTYTYTLTSQSASTDPLSITSLKDDNGTAGSTADDVNVLTAGTFLGGDTNGNHLLDSGETWKYSYLAHNVVANAGNLTNVAVVNAADDEGNNATSTDDATVAVNDVKPGIDVTKSASITTVQAGVPTQVTFNYTVTNQSSTATDPLKIDTLVDDNATASTADDHSLLTNYVSGDSNGNGLVDKGETWKFAWTTSVTATQQSTTNTVKVVAHDDENNSVNDSATATINATNFFHTPGFWSNNGSLLWDGNAGTNPNGQLGITGRFTGGSKDIAYTVLDANADGIADSAAAARGTLMIGDWNANGIADANENVLVINRADAMSLLDASTKQQQDGRWVLARDVVASWLNYLSGSYVGDSSNPTSVRHYMDEATAWLMQTTVDHNHQFTVAELSSGATAQSTAPWGQGYDFNANGIKGQNMVPASGDDHIGAAYNLDLMAGNLIHSGLDHYNNTGWIF